MFRSLNIKTAEFYSEFANYYVTGDFIWEFSKFRAVGGSAKKRCLLNISIRNGIYIFQKSCFNKYHLGIGDQIQLQ